jgi:selenocysteine-specific elongation factor
MPEAQLRGLCADLTASSKLVTVPAPVPILLLPTVAERLEKATIARVTDFHRQNPLLRGISREELRTQLYRELPPEVFRYSLDRLVERQGLLLQDEFVCLHGREVQLSPEECTIREEIESCYKKGASQPPSLSEVMKEARGNPAAIRKIHFWMIKERILVKLSEDMIYHRQALEEIKHKIRTALAPGSRFGVAEFKDLFGLTRKHAIPLLEYLDRERVTRREGNDRVLL